MKRSFIYLLLIYFLPGNITGAQDPEPACACNQPEFIVELGGKLILNYKELNICTMDDGSILLQNRDTDEYFIVKGGAVQGPLKPEDPRIAGFSGCYPYNMSTEEMLLRYKGILSKTGDLYKITMGGKSYGPFIELVEFRITTSGDKFIAIAYAKEGEMPRLLTNIPNVTFDIINTLNTGLCEGIKYDEILVVTDNKILNLQGKTVLNIKPEMSACGTMFISTSNTRSAYYDSGTLTFSDNTSLPDVFNPHLIKTGGVVYLAYMYYSPKRKAIMQCKIPF